MCVYFIDQDQPNNYSQNSLIYLVELKPWTYPVLNILVLTEQYKNATLCNFLFLSVNSALIVKSRTNS